MAEAIVISTSPVVARTDGGSGDSSLLLVRLEVGSDDGAASRICGAPSLAADVCILVDCSWWMHEDKLLEPEGQRNGMFRSKLEVVRTAITPLPTELVPGNTMSLIAFSNSTSVLANRTGRNQADIYHTAVQSFQARSGCQLAIGLGEAGRLLKACPPNRVGRIVLLTGGKIEDSRAALLVADELADDGIGIDAVGVGQESRLMYLQQLVAPGAGRACLVHTAEQATDVLRRLVTEAQCLGAHRIRVQLTTPDGWKVRGCVRRALDNLVLPTTGADEDKVWFARMAGISPRLGTELYFFLIPSEGATRPLETPLSLTVDCVTPSGEQSSQKRSVSSLLNSADSTNPTTPNIELMQGFSKVEIKCWEKEWEDAAQRSDHASAEAFLVEMIQRLDQLGLSPGQEIAAKALQLYRQKREIPNEACNALIEYTSAIDVGRLPLNSPAATCPAESEDKLCGPPPVQPASPAVDLMIEHLLMLCSEALKRRDNLAAVVTHDAADIEALRQERVESPGSVLYAKTNAWLRRIRDVGPAWIEEQQSHITDLCTALREWDDLERWLGGERDQLSKRLKILSQVLDTIAFYHWNDCGWLSSLEALKRRRDLLERSCQGEAINGLL